SAQQYANELTYGISRDEWNRVIAEYNARWDRFSGNRDAEPQPWQGDRVDRTRVQYEIAMDRSYWTEGGREITSLPVSAIMRSLPRRAAYLWSTADMSLDPGGHLHRFVQFHYLMMICLVGLGLWVRRRDLLKHWLLWIVPIYVTGFHMV